MKSGFSTKLVALAGACLLAASPAPASAQGIWSAAKELLTPGSPGVNRPLSVTQRRQILAALETAPSHGLPGYNVSPNSSDGELVRAAVSYGNALRGGRMSGKFTGDWHLRPEPFDAAGSFQQALRKNRLRQWFQQQEPHHQGYQELRQALSFYRDIESYGGWKPLTATRKALKVGSKGPGVLRLRERLGIEYAAPAPQGDASVFDEALTEALKAEQARLGVAVTGVLDKATVAALNVPASARVRTIEANLERWRWMPSSMPRYRVEVNVPDYRLEVWRDNDRPLAMKAIVGKPATPTPMFQDVMDTLVFNPPWNVPPRIAKNDILPKAKKDKAYLVKHDYFISDDGRLIQKAGPKSALGKIKFNLTNPFAIYLHDTPSKHLFKESARAFSNGCIRLEQPMDLAQLV
ncbi:MAG TPA: L,D-transpeptidase family protein, partial [Caulobacteraceae bacterium]|nr:L,D-transpeptidase family protein [Caulobacteraceae bacterium]